MYIAVYQNVRIEVYARGPNEARVAAQNVFSQTFKNVKPYEIGVYPHTQSRRA